MTLRAILLGLLSAAIIAGATYFNDNTLQQTMLIGNHLPISVYGTLIVFLLLVNPLLARLGHGAPLRGSELAIIIGLTTVACAIPGSGLLRTMNAMLILPHQLYKTEAGWSREGQDLMEIAPDQMLADIEGNETIAMNGFIQGLGRPDQSFGLSDIPWEAWITPLSFWIPLVLFLFVAMIGLSLVLHQQWSHHEQLPYPLARFADALLPKKNETKGSIFRNPLFWAATIVVALIHANNYAYTWFPSLIQIPSEFDFKGLLEIFPAIKAEGIDAYNLRLYYTVVAIGYFLAADVGLALALGPFIYPFIGAFFTSQGVSLKGGGQQSPERYVVAGAYVGFFMSLVYTGRYYYLNTFKKAVGFKKSTGSNTEEIPSQSIWGARVFLIGVIAFTSMLIIVGLDWPVAVFFTAVSVILFVVMGRLIAETGLFFMQPWWLPAAIITGILGAKALGPEAVMILFLVSVMLMIDPREALMPYLVNALKLFEIRGVHLGKSSAMAGVSLLIALAIAVPATFYFQYRDGANLNDTHATKSVPRIPFKETQRVTQKLAAQGALEESRSMSSFERLGSISPDGGSLTAFTVGLGLVLIFAVCRLRFAKWPIHPVIFLVFASYASLMFAFSFLLGWIIKRLVTKYSGEQGYHYLKPMMIGLIAGDMLGGGVPIIIGWTYHFITGGIPESFQILPT